MKNPNEIKGLIQAINRYLLANKLELPNNAEIIASIDAFTVYVGDYPVLVVGDRPPTVIFEVHETEHTHKYLRPQTVVAA